VLVGIARLAASGSLLEAKSRVDYRELPTRSFINRSTSPRVPFEWTINPYRGCEFGCKYCYARYTHEFMELRDGADFERQIFAKRWNPTAFREELRRIPRDAAIAIGTATDPYQPAERRYGVTRSILLELARERGRRLSLTTKSDLVTRDAELLAQVGSGNILHVSLSITTVDERLARQMGPYAPRPGLRLHAVEQLAKAGVRAGVFIKPILPLLNDSQASIDGVAEAAARSRAAFLGGGVVFLKDCVLAVLLPWLEKDYPHLVRKYRERFTRSPYLKGQYPEIIGQRVEAARLRYSLPAYAVDYQPELWEGEPQLSPTLSRNSSVSYCFFVSAYTLPRAFCAA